MYTQVLLISCFFCKHYFFYFEDSKISKVLYATNYDNSPYATDFNVYPGKSYSVSIKVLRNGLGNADAKVSKIKLNGQNIGECNPDGLDDDCTFFDCDSSLTEKSFASDSETLTLKLSYVGNSEKCSCDTSTWECSSNLESDEANSPTIMTAVARITLTPVKRKNFLVHFPKHLSI